MKGEIFTMPDPANDGSLSGNNPSTLWKTVSRLLSRRRNVTEEDILEMVDAGEEKGVLEESQKDMINNIFEFNDMSADEIMTPRTDVFAVDADASVAEALSISIENGVSRLPIYEEDIDHVIGVLHIKDLLPYVGKALPEDLSLRSLMHKAHFVPSSKRCSDLFSDMTERHLQLVMAIDEYGGLAGIVTMEDILEAIVGNIQDEYDNEEEEVKQTGENTFEVDAHEQVEEMIRFLQNNLQCRNEDIKEMEDCDLVLYLRKKFNRPMRVCGMVKNVGEPGGGPFLAYNQDGTISLQILESSQIDMNNPEAKSMFENGTHFNPVDLVCAVKGYKGEKFNLPAFVDKNTGFISHKSKNGRELKAMELPGLWNGAMSDWNTIFVEVPLVTFNPVKTVNDLLREVHQ